MQLIAQTQLAAHFIKAISSATDGKALFIKKRSNFTNQHHFMVLVVATITAPFHWTQLRKLLFPITQNVRFDPAQIADFTYREVTLGGDGGKGFLQLNQCS